MTTTHTSGKKFPIYNASFVFTYPSKHTETHADNGRCSAAKESKVDVTKTGNGERGAGSGERGTVNGSKITSGQRYPP